MARRAFVLALLGTALAASPLPAQTINTGWELSTTTLTLGGNQYVGVPLVTFNFGAGSVGTGTADTIVRRTVAASAPGPGAIPVTLVGFQLRSFTTIDLGSGLDYHYLTLQSDRGGAASTGTTTVNFGPDGPTHGGAYSTAINLAYDLRIGSPTGTILFMNSTPLGSSGSWSNVAPGGALTISGVNLNLNGASNAADFWAAPVPEPGFVLAVAAAGAVVVRRIRSRRNG